METLTLHRASINNMTSYGTISFTEAILYRLNGQDELLMLDNGYEQCPDMVDYDLEDKPFAAFNTADSEELIDLLFLKYSLVWQWANL